MTTRIWTMAVLMCILMPKTADAQMGLAASKKYQALKYPTPPSSGTWAILDHDGARRKVEPYLSSLGGGESGAGVIVSPTFTMTADKITFTICGHDGQQGGRGHNYISLVDYFTGKTLIKTTAPGTDAMQERSWDVSKLSPRRVHIEVHDSNTDGAYAWLGIGSIDAGPELRLDFSRGLPEDWKVTQKLPGNRTESVMGGIPFKRLPAVYTMVPSAGAAEIPCGFTAERLFFLGCTVHRGKPPEVYGTIEIFYRGGRTERYPLMFGFTLDGQDKLPSHSKAMHLHASGDPFQHYLVIRPRREEIEKIRLARNRERDAIPRITAITCETTASAGSLLRLPSCSPKAEEQAWIGSHALSADYPNMEEIRAEIQRACKK